MQDNLSGIEHSICKGPSTWWDGEVVHSLAMVRHTGTFVLEKATLSMKALRPMRRFAEGYPLCLCRTGLGKVILVNATSPTSKETVEKIYKRDCLTELAVEARYDIESVLPKQITFVHTDRRIGGTLSRFNSKRAWNAIAKIRQAWSGLVESLQMETTRWSPIEYDEMRSDNRVWKWPRQGLEGYPRLNDVLCSAFELLLQPGNPCRWWRYTPPSRWLQGTTMAQAQMVFPTIGGGIGTAAMFLLRKKHIGDQQSGLNSSAMNMKISLYERKTSRKPAL